ncbi:MAG: methylated-DNA-[protein]-cysteine S-methyltransferase [Halobacteriales archaeon]|jgi:methylated-DNA-[protein]-cysteine S-methyltransferase
MDVTVRGYPFEIDETLIAADPGKIRTQVAEYERGERDQFDLDVEFPDDFTGRVMREMATIPHGETRTYGEIADAIDSSAVAVGQACGRNPVPLVVPCHRVVAADSLGGFSGGGENGLAAKEALLEHEGALEPRSEWGSLRSDDPTR